MRFLPYEKLLLKTPLTESQVEMRLKNFIEPKKFRPGSILLYGSNSKPYEGAMKGTKFRIWRIIYMNNIFLPEIKGEFEYLPNETLIHVKMKLQDGVLVSSCALILMGLSSFSILGVEQLMAHGKISIKIFSILGVTLFVYFVIILGSFKAETIRSKRDLAELFDAEIEEI